MGYEVTAKIPAGASTQEIRERIISAFITEGALLVRDDGRCFSIAIANRKSTSWDEDFVVCINEDQIYVLDHVSYSTSTQEIQATITNCLKDMYPDLVWEEL